MLTAVTVLKLGGCYSPIWVDRLVRQIKEHIRPDRIVCLTDMDVKSCEVIPLKHGWPGWHSKLELFRPDILSGPTVYLDLDSAVLGPVPFRESRIFQFEELTGDPVVLWMLDDFYVPSRPASGVMAWTPSANTEHIYEKFASHPECLPGFKNGDGAIIGKHWHGRLQKAFPGVFGSYKAHKLQAGPRDFKVVCWHGPPKFPDLPKDNWARREWEKTE